MSVNMYFIVYMLPDSSQVFKPSYISFDEARYNALVLSDAYHIVVDVYFIGKHKEVQYLRSYNNGSRVMYDYPRIKL